MARPAGFNFFDTNALLGMYKLHLCSSEQIQMLMDHARIGTPPGSMSNAKHSLGTVLDIGAGEGGVTKSLVDLSSKVIATETAPYMAKRLRKKLRIEVWNEDVATTALGESASRDPHTFDTVAPILLCQGARYLVLAWP